MQKKFIFIGMTSLQCLLAAMILLTAMQSNGQDSSYRMVFYNVENFFDCKVDTTLQYNQFTPEGEMFWSCRRFSQKATRISKVLLALSSWDGFAVAGLCEVEGREVLDELIYNTPIREYGYKYIHYDSHDSRGIDVALLYGPDFLPLSSKSVEVRAPDGQSIDSRDILYVKGLLAGDTIHIFVNHWTSRYRGLLESKRMRMWFANKLKAMSDSIENHVPGAMIVAMGDFNDQHSDESMMLLTSDDALVNLEATTLHNNAAGTVKFKADWFTFDQVLVSKSLHDNSGALQIAHQGLRVFDETFLLVEDKKHLGLKPYRTYVGYKYNGGFSDHLPVFVDLIYGH